MKLKCRGDFFPGGPALPGWTARPLAGNWAGEGFSAGMAGKICSPPRVLSHGLGKKLVQASWPARRTLQHLLHENQQVAFTSYFFPGQKGFFWPSRYTGHDRPAPWLSWRAGCSRANKGPRGENNILAPATRPVPGGGAVPRGKTTLSGTSKEAIPGLTA